MHNTLMSQWRPHSHVKRYRQNLFLAKPMRFREQFDGILFHFGRWTYEQLGEVWERLVDGMLDRRIKGGNEEQWKADQEKIALLFERAGWTDEEFNNELERRLEAKFGWP